MNLFRIFSSTYAGLVVVVILLTTVFYIVETVFPAEANQSFSSRLRNTLYYPIILAWILFAQWVVTPIYLFFLQAAGGGLLLRFVSPPKGFAGQALFGLTFALVWDFWQYWIHRLQHAWPVLWETHKFHHNETALNASAQSRHHASNALLFALLYFPLAMLFGPLAPHFVATFLMFKLWGFVNHANIRFHAGPLTALVSNPQWHRIHHSVLRKHHDKNFAAFFPVLDLVFGTYYHPRKDEYPATGIAPGQDVSYLRDATVAPFAAWYQMVGRRDKRTIKSPRRISNQFSSD